MVDKFPWRTIFPEYAIFISSKLTDNVPVIDDDPENDQPELLPLLIFPFDVKALNVAPPIAALSFIEQ